MYKYTIDNKNPWSSRCGRECTQLRKPERACLQGFTIQVH